MSTRTTDGELRDLVTDVSRLLGTTLVLHRGSNGAAKYNNILLRGTVNMWPDGMGGRSAKDAYNALRLMRAALAAKADAENAR